MVEAASPVAALVKRWAWPVITVVLAAIVTVGLVTGDHRGPDRARSLASRLRCPVCQAESVADSPSETAQQMNQVIADQVREGRTDGQILAFFRARYGDWILLDPPKRGATLLVWALPALALLAGLVAVFRHAGGRSTVALSDDDRARVELELARARARSDAFEDNDDD